MIGVETRTALQRSLTDAIFELAEHLHERSVDADALVTTETAEAISGLGGTIALLAQSATAIARLQRTNHE